MELLIELVKLATAIVVLLATLRRCHSAIEDDASEKKDEDR